VHAARATGAQHLGRRNISKDILSYLIVPQIKQLGAVIVADVADPAGYQSAVRKWRLGSSPDVVR
jgi:hypothetical protein